MAREVSPAEPAAFEFELFDGDPDHLRTVVATSSRSTPWIDPVALKLRHRIGRGPFGDVWLATHHQSNKDFEEYHEVIIKMLHPVSEDHVRTVLEKFDEVFLKCQGIEGVCWLHGISVLSGKICVIMKFYEGSVGDKMARLRGGKLSLPDALRYGINLAQGLVDLHSREILVLNLKPCNFLLDEMDQAVVGDIGIPYLLLGIALPSSNLSDHLGTPNYMAPEQWEPDARGPISFETDSWGFGCSVIEMLTGVRPWSGLSAEEIKNLVVTKQEKPQIPCGLPPLVDIILHGCFEYDFRSRPLVKDILATFRSELAEIKEADGWKEPGFRSKVVYPGYTEWFLSKDQLQVGDVVRSRKPPRTRKLENMDVPEGTMVGLESETGSVLVRVHGVHDPIRVSVLKLERVTNGLAAGDWVRLRNSDKNHSPVGILHSINRNGTVAVGFIGRKVLWKGSASDLHMAEPFFVGQFVRLKANVRSPRLAWPWKRGGCRATGRISWVLPNGCLVMKFPGLLPFGEEAEDFLADPAEVETVNFNTCPGLVEKYQHLEDFHWSVRPLLLTISLFTAIKLGSFIGKKITGSKGRDSRGKDNQVERQPPTDAQSGNNSGWLPPPVANMLFREGLVPG
ncbi:hypothetical protein MLD38_014597 [Melastoma candidum]|uniref:Uncharacterized protein n=1 Tax=Melastoma candidum TaxID=119954 RepID=A0ACB9RDF5_9MYRT|nr:hypothetical protein MLD38_014597 [Melastoma candidum]